MEIPVSLFIEFSTLLACGNELAMDVAEVLGVELVAAPPDQLLLLSPLGVDEGLQILLGTAHSLLQLAADPL
jgi:hypothetical protein